MGFLIKNKQNLIILILVALFLAFLYFYFGDIEKTFVVAAITCGSLLLVGLLFFNFFWYYIIAITLIPISIDAQIIGGAQINLPAEILIALAIPIVLLFGSTKKNIKSIFIHPISLLLITDLLFHIFTSLMSTHIDVSLKRVLIKILFFLGFYVLITLNSKKKNELIKFLAYCIGLVPVMYFTIRNHIHHSFDPRAVFNISAPYFSDHTIYGACLAFVIPFLIILIIKRDVFNFSKIQLIGIVFLTIAIIISEFLALSRASILSLVVAIIFAVLLKFRVQFKFLMLGLFALFSITFVFREDLLSLVQKTEAVSNDGQITNHLTSVTNVQTDASNLERINRWICAYRMFEAKPLTGFGPGTYQFEYNQFQTLENKTYISTNFGDRGNAHSEYLTYLSETGIFGFLLFLIIVFTTIYFGMKNHYFIQNQYYKLINLAVLLGLITFFFHGIFNSFIDQSKMAFLYFGALAIIVKINIREQSTSVKYE